MRAVVLDMPAHWLDERRRQGADRWDEVCMVPPPGTSHQLFASDLEAVLRSIAQARGLVVLHETGVFRSRDETNYRVPDLVVVERARLSQRGVEQRAEIVIEILSPDDESRDKLPFYRECGVVETWLLDPVTRAFEIFSLADGYACAGGTSAMLDVQLAIAPGPRLRLAWAGAAAEI